MKTIQVVTGAFLAVVLACSWTQAAERDPKYYQQQFDQWSKEIANLRESDKARSASQDIEIIRTWIGQAQAYLASERLEEIDPLLTKIKAQVMYVQSKIGRVAVEKQAQKVGQQANDTEAEAAKIKEAAEAAVAREKELEAQGL